MQAGLRVLVTRPAEEARALAHRLRADGHEPVLAPLLDIVPLADPGPWPDRVQAIVLTSARAASFLPSDACALPVFAVGEATARAAAKAGAVDVTAGPGDGLDLARLVTQACRPERGAIVHLGGRERRPGLDQGLRAGGYDVLVRTVYDAVPASALPEPAASRLAEGSIDRVLLFSPRSGETFARLAPLPAEAGAVPADGLVHADVCCLSEAVAATVRFLLWRSVRLAGEPTLEALLAACMTSATPGQGRAARLDGQG